MPPFTLKTRYLGGMGAPEEASIIIEKVGWVRTTTTIIEEAMDFTDNIGKTIDSITIIIITDDIHSRTK